MQTRLVNIRYESPDIASNPDYVYIGRGSIWGNPYHIGKLTRLEVIEKYRTYILSKPHLLAKLPELKGKILGCYCTPLPCHGEVLIDLLEHY